MDKRDMNQNSPYRTDAGHCPLPDVVQWLP